MTRHAGDHILMIRKSHTWLWLPRFYRHCSGGVGCHWLRLFFLYTPSSKEST